MWIDNFMFCMTIEIISEVLGVLGVTSYAFLLLTVVILSLNELVDFLKLDSQDQVENIMLVGNYAMLYQLIY